MVTEVANIEEQFASIKAIVDKLLKENAEKDMYVEHIQSLVANAVKAQLGDGSCKTRLYTKPDSKRIDALGMPVVICLPSSTSLMVRTIPNSILLISLRRVVMLVRRETN